MPTFLVLVERTIIDHYHVEADSIDEANERFRFEWEGYKPMIPYHTEELDAEIRDEETTEVTA